MTKQHIFTTGYAGFNQESFLWKIQFDHIEVIIDVREKPFSRNRSFSLPNLRNFLEKNGIKYYHFEELGVPSHLRSFLRSGGDLTEYFDSYRSHLTHQESSLNRLVDILLKNKCCLLCLEKNPLECHRSVLANLLLEQYEERFEVRHI